MKENSDEILGVDDRCFTDCSNDELRWLFLMDAEVEI